MILSRLLLAILVGPLAMLVSADAQVIVAHRGASFDAPENTLAAFRLAWQQQADGIEADFYLTADDQIVCIHDKSTERTTAQDRLVEQSTLQELRQLEAGSWKDPKFAGEQIPTFEEVLATVPAGGLFVIELKSGQEIVPVLARELKRLSALDRRLLIITFDAETAAQSRKQIPEVPVHWLTSFKRDERSGTYQPSADQIAETVRRVGAQGVGMQGNREVIDILFVEQLQRGGCDEFHVWTIDSPETALYFQALGAFGITTNRPKLIRQALEPVAN